jgi:hypothetical protein
VLVFSNLTYVGLDREKLPPDWPNHGNGHFQREELPSSTVNAAST